MTKARDPFTADEENVWNAARLPPQGMSETGCAGGKDSPCVASRQRPLATLTSKPVEPFEPTGGAVAFRKKGDVALGVFSVTAAPTCSRPPESTASPLRSDKIGDAED